MRERELCVYVCVCVCVYFPFPYYYLFIIIRFLNSFLPYFFSLSFRTAEIKVKSKSRLLFHKVKLQTDLFNLCRCLLFRYLTFHSSFQSVFLSIHLFSFLSFSRSQSVTQSQLFLSPKRLKLKASPRIEKRKKSFSKNLEIMGKCLLTKLK